MSRADHRSGRVLSSAVVVELIPGFLTGWQELTRMSRFMGRGVWQWSLESAVDAGVAAVLAASAGYAMLRVAEPVLPSAALPLFALGWSAAVLFQTFRMLRHYGETNECLSFFNFTAAPFAFGEHEPMDELLLSDADRLIDVQPAPPAPPDGSADELLLDDILAKLGPDSRVVRLFDPAAMLTAGQLKANIDRSLQRRRQAAAPDASQALHEALAELRQSLR